MSWCTQGAVLASESQDQARHFTELIQSLPFQIVLLVLYAGLAALAFSRLAREFTDDLRWLRAVVGALGVFVVLEFLLGDNVLGLVVWPLWVQLIVTIWVFAMVLYYVVRFMTKVRPGEPNAAAQARGAALEHVLDEAEVQARGRRA